MRSSITSRTPRPPLRARLAALFAGAVTACALLTAGAPAHAADTPLRDLGAGHQAACHLVDG